MENVWEQLIPITEEEIEIDKQIVELSKQSSCEFLHDRVEHNEKVLEETKQRLIEYRQRTKKFLNH